MADVELLPCGECGMPCRAGEYHPFAACLMFKACHNSETVRANLAPLQAEIEALRVRADAMAGEAIKHEARAERLAEALREARDYVATALLEERAKFAGHEDCSDIPGIEADLHKIDTALRDHDKEVGNG